MTADDVIAQLVTCLACGIALGVAFQIAKGK